MIEIVPELITASIPIMLALSLIEIVAPVCITSSVLSINSTALSSKIKLPVSSCNPVSDWIVITVFEDIIQSPDGTTGT